MAFDLFDMYDSILLELVTRKIDSVTISDNYHSTCYNDYSLNPVYHLFVASLQQL